ncbi:gliding motility-associated C-terminal domain-containing protein, partial [Flavobacterium sp. 7A]|uniref:DUF7507 domain-containing protein n=1 Tax=Flavobacterium sp. 7A TaxID=2940571 RepID=UPI002226E051
TGVYNGDATNAKVGDKITYTFNVKNTGNVTVLNVKINDTKLGVSDLAIVPASLAPNGFGEVTKEYTITQADIDSGKVTNTAVAKGKDSKGNDVQDTSGTAIDNDDTTVTNLPTAGKIVFVKTGVYNGDATKAKVGDKITYTFNVKNIGNVAINTIIINDAKLGIASFPLVPSTLLPNESSEITKDYSITQLDIDLGKVINTAIVKGQDPMGNNIQDTSGTDISNNDSTVTTIPFVSSIALVKTAVIIGPVMVGSTIDYTFSVTNTGNSTIKNIVVTDPMVGIILPVSTIATLAVGETNNSIVGKYTIKQIDVDAGKVVNSALAVGMDPGNNVVRDTSGTTINNDDATETPFIQSPSISLTKEGIYQDTNGDGITSIGDIIKYVFEVKNTGNTVLTNVKISDDNATVLGIVIPVLNINASNNTAFTAEYSITQEDINTGVVYNLANALADTPVTTIPTVTAQSTDPTPCTTCPVNPSCLTCTMTLLNQVPKISLLMNGTLNDENGDGMAQVGETISYTYTVMNTGDVPLTSVWIEDSKVGLNQSSGTIDLPVGGIDKTTFTAVYVITQADIIEGMVWSQSKASGFSPAGVIVQDLSDDSSPLEDDVTSIIVNGCELRPYNAVSPDGDGMNDFFFIQGADCYPNNIVQIFDRWGVKVYDVNGYDNIGKAFRGISEGRETINKAKRLPTGTYFYVIKYEDKNGNDFGKSGYLHLIN